MVEIAKPYAVTPEAIAKRRAAGRGPEGDVERFTKALEALAPLGIALLMIGLCGACLIFAPIW